MKKIALATGNEGKSREFNHAFEGTGIRFVPLSEFPGAPQAEENGSTYRANALIKARAVAAHTGLPTVADDSGIEINALAGELGVNSARAWGEKPYSDINSILLERLKNAQNRRARYVCVIALADPASGEEKTWEGVCEGIIHHTMEGSGGFGYDPIFFVPEYGKTMAQLPLEVKNSISHRARAVAQLKVALTEGWRPRKKIG